MWLLACILATWRLTWDLTSDAELEGPFHVYDGIRWLLKRPFWPVWVREGIACPYCVSAWAGGMFALAAVVATGAQGWAAGGMWLVYTFAAAGGTALLYRMIRLIYGVEAKEF